MTTKNSTRMNYVIDRRSYFSFITSFVVILYAVGSWAPQYFHTRYTPLDVNYLFADTHMDFYGVYASAREWSKGKSARFLEPGDGPEVYAYPIGGVYNCYGPAMIVGIWPLTNIPFEKLRPVMMPLWMCATGFFLYLVFRLMSFPEWPLWSIVTVVLLFMVTSGPLNMLIERGNCEVLIPILLFPFCLHYVRGSVTLGDSILLGLAVHLKMWPIFFLALLLEKRYWRHGALAAGVCVGLHAALHPWIPIQETISAMRSFGDATAKDFYGHAIVSLYSFLKCVGVHAHWKTVSGVFLVANGLFVLYLLYGRKIRVTDENVRKYLASYCVLVALLSPNAAVEYVLISVFLVFGFLFSMPKIPVAVAALLLVIVTSTNQLGRWDGPLKALCMLVLLGYTASMLLADEARVAPEAG